MKKGLFASIFGKKKGDSEARAEEMNRDLIDTEDKVGRWTILVRYSKEKSPEETERIFKDINERTESCAVVLMDYNQKEQIKASENMSWLYDVKYELLNKDTIHQIVTVGKRCFDYRVRCLLAGIGEEKIAIAPMSEKVKDLIDLEQADTICFVAAPSTYIVVESIKEELMETMKKREKME